MNNKTQEVISDYYTELQKAFRIKKLDFNKLHLDEQVRIIGPNESFEGFQNVKEMFFKFIAIVDKFNIKKQYFDEDSSCTVLDCVTSTPAGTVLTTELINIKEGRIVEIYIIYDTAAWAKIAPLQSE